MHARMIRRNLRGHGWTLLLAGVAVIGIELLALACASRAHAAINVSYFTLEPTDGYVSRRVYAGTAVSSRAAELGFKQGGQVLRVAVDIGDAVQSGDTLALLDTASLQASLRQAHAEVAHAHANLQALHAEVQLARNTERRFRTLHEQGHTSQQLYDEANLSFRMKAAQHRVAAAGLERARAAQQGIEVAIAEATILAPFDGIIQSRYVDEGAQVGSGQAALRIVERGVVEAHIGVPAQVAARLAPGSRHAVIWMGGAHEGLLSAVLPEIDRATRTQTVVLKVADAAIPPGSVVEIAVSEQIDEPGFWVPLGALTAGDRGLWGVYALNRDNVVERRLVEILHRESDRVFVRGTIAGGDRVIDTGVQRIVPGQTVDVHATKVSHAR